MCLAVLGGIQPAKIEEFINRSTTAAGDDGFLERFQIAVYPETRGTWEMVDKAPNQAAIDDVCALFSQLDAIKLGSPPVYFTREAQELYYSWRKTIEAKIRNRSLAAIFQGYLGKYRSLMPSLALIFELCESEGEISSVSYESAKKAVAWCEILFTHVNKIYSRTIHNPVQGAVILAKKIVSGGIPDGENLRLINRRNLTGLKTSEDLEKAINVLSKLDWVRKDTRTGRGGTSEFLRINPHLTADDLGALS
jgi:hypothetical protein